MIYVPFFQSENFGLTSPNGSFPTAQSTPVTKRSTVSSTNSLQTPNTSLLESGKTSPIRSQKLSEAPRTPTPFKRALADVYQRCEPLSNTVIQNDFLSMATIHLEDDLSQFLETL